jgi:hypothetical protein
MAHQHLPLKITFTDWRNDHMKKIITIISLLALLAGNTLFAGTSEVYVNTFDGPEDLDGTIVGTETITVDSVQMKTAIAANFGRATLVLNSDMFTPAYHPALSENDGPVTWWFNLSHENPSIYNNTFHFVLAGTTEDPFDGGAQGYYFKGGDVAGDRMGIFRFDSGLSGTEQVIVNVEDGLGTLPDKGSFKITYNPGTDEWTLYGEIAQDYTDPSVVNTFLGSAVDATHTDMDTPYIGFGGANDGNVYFDNIGITVEDTTAPEAAETDPADNATGVDVDAQIVVTFSEFMDPATLTTLSFLVNDGAVDINGAITCEEGVAVFTPDANLTTGTTYTVTVTIDATDLGGNPLQGVYTFSFTTIDGGGDGGGGGGGGGCFISTGIGSAKK